MVRYFNKHIVQGSIRFAKWSRKGWGIFNSLGREISIGHLDVSVAVQASLKGERTVGVFTGHDKQLCVEDEEKILPDMMLEEMFKVVLLLAVYFCCFGLVIAQTDSAAINKKISLGEVEVTARRSSSVYSEVGRVLHVISRKEIEELPVYSVQDLLRYAMNVDVRQRGPLGIQADVSMRGGSFDQVMILFNGINVTDPQTGHLSLNLPVDMQSIERVEILEGPGARVYGPGAFSGAINFITGSKTSDNATFNVLVGQNGLYKLSANTTFKTGQLKNYVAAGAAGSDGYIINTDFENHSLFYQSRLNFGAEQLDCQFGYNNKAFGANAFYSPKYPLQYEQNITTFASVKMTSGNTIKVSPALYWRRHQDRFELFREKGYYEKNADGLYMMGDEIAGYHYVDENGEFKVFPYAGHNYHLTEVYGANMNVVIPWLLGKTSFGGELRSENILSNNIGNDMDKPVSVPGEDALFIKSYQRTNISVFFEHVYSYNRFSVSAGMLINRNSALDLCVDFFPGVDVSYWASDKVKLWGSINKTLRLPTFTDLFYSGPTNIGNVQLKPEEALTCEGGFKILSTWFNGQAGVYYRSADNLIDWGRQEGETKYQTRNLSEIDSYGVNVQGQFALDKLIGDFPLNVFSFGYAYVDQDKNVPDGYESIYVMDYLKYKLNLRLDFKLTSKLLGAVNIQWEDREGGCMTFVGDAYNYLEVPAEYKPFWLTDMRLQWSENKYKVFVDVNNMFDIKYYDLGNLPQPGRWIKAGMQVSLDW